MATGWPMKTTYANGDVYSASDVNDITGTINLLGSSVAYTAGKNKIINGDFGVWQRGTSFSNPTDNTYTADRFTYYSNGSNTRTISQQTFTPGTAPVAGYEGTFFFRYNQATAGSGAGYNGIYHRVENVRTLAGQAVTLSVWAKADSARTLSLAINRNYGSGGSSMEYSVVTDSNMSVTTGWTRFTYSFTMPSVSGKTIGSGSYVEIGIKFPLNVTQTCDLWGLQLEAGSTATAFQTASGTIGGELALCQRYYYRVVNPASSGSNIGISTYGSAATTGFVGVTIPHPVTMRTAPSSVDFSSSLVVSPDELNSSISVSGVALSGFSNSNNLSVLLTVSGATQYRPYRLYGSGSTTYLGFSAEL